MNIKKIKCPSGFMVLFYCCHLCVNFGKKDMVFVANTEGGGGGGGGGYMQP